MKKERGVLLIGLMILALISLGKLADFYGEFLWFKAMEYSSIFKTIFLAKGLIGLIFGGVFAFLAGLNIYLARKMGPQKPHWELTLRGRGQDLTQVVPIPPEYVNKFLLAGCLALSIIMGVWPAAKKWSEFLCFFSQTPFSALDPIFHKDIGFFVFSYPVYLFLQKWLFIAIAIISAAVGFIYLKDGAMRLKIGQIMFTKRAKAHLSVLIGLLLVLVAWDRRLKMLGLLYSPRGVAFGASYTDMHAQLIGYWIIIVIAAVSAFLFWINLSGKGWKWPLIGLACLFLISIIAGGLYPWALQTFVVEPNELTKEKPYIENNIRFTRLGYNLDKIVEKNFPATNDLNLESIQNNSLTLKNVKLWDPIPLKQSYTELQEMRLYYDFIGIDEDRYILKQEKTQVMLSARELDQRKLPPQAQTWENRHFKFTHGYGLCMNPVNHVTEKGLPNLIIKDIPPVSFTDITITRPEIYYGEAQSDFVIVNTATKEFDYPKGDSNVYTQYQGMGGVTIGSYLNRLIYSLKFSDPKILLTHYISSQSRIMFHRQIKDLAKTLAPFLIYDHDPYVVASRNGKIYWILDGYTTTDLYPYSESSELAVDDDLPQQNLASPFFAGQWPRAKKINYIRNSVKVVIDAYQGSTTFYLFDEKEPIIKTYQKIFPRLFRPFSEMPEDLVSHIRYPRDLFEIQANMYSTYHMQDAQVFYNKEDLYDLPIQKSLVKTALSSSDQNDTALGIESPMKGYYIIMRLPDRPTEEFILMVPFTPNNKSNMIAWMCAQCDGKDYGQLMVYKFPKEKLIYGPRQIEARIDQQTEISSEITLWSQQGSEVFRGELLVIPIEKSIMYIEPVYLMAADKSKLPELKRVIVAYGEKIFMEHSLAEALVKIFGQAKPAAAAASSQSEAQISPTDQERPSGVYSLNELAKKANQYYQLATESLRKGQWAEYGQYQEKLQAVIQQIMEESEVK